MVKLGSYAINMGGFTNLTELVFSEAAKYLLLLLLAVLAFRLWRRLPQVPRQNKRSNLLLAGLVTLLAVTVGYCSLEHSLSRLYLYYGQRAFDSGYLTSASSLFQKSSECFQTADALGKQGVCSLWLGQPDQGRQLLAEAARRRHGRLTSFEAFYQGLYYFLQGQSRQSIPLLEQASTDPAYTWSVTRIFAVVYIDNNQPADAERLLAPFAGVEVTSCDHAYAVASLDLLKGKTAEAKMLADKFSSGDLPPFWKSRFDQLQAKIHTQNP